ncbi:Protein PNS1 [Ananas comosus]|uniref:Choline transporter-like protein n=1 Tax=Ananas comosus TaxID=4615 RepID=A0A199V3R2_ANACO|nr:Protein PNS1 [Ananas comosus]
MGALEDVTESRAAETGEDRKEEKIEEKEEEKKRTEGGGDADEVVVVVDSSDHQNHQRRELTAAATATATAATAATATVSRLHAQHPVPPIQVVSSAASASAYPPITPTPPQAALASLNSRAYTNRLSLFLFALHQVAAAAAVAFFVFKAIQGVLDPDSPKARREKRVLRFWLPPIEGAAAVSIILAFAWQKAVRTWPSFMVTFILWSSFAFTMAAGVLLLCFSLPATAGIGVALILFSIGTGLYACWVTRRIPFTARVFSRALLPAQVRGPQRPGVPHGRIGLPLDLGLVMRNVTNLTVSRVVALYYLRGMQSSTQFSFQRAVSRNLGSACLGSLFVPTIEALRILARGLNLLEGEDEFMFSCAHCCLHVMESVFRYGNSWAFVHIAAYGRGFVAASQSTWGLFERQGMEELVDSDITSSVCFLTGVCSGAICTIFAASWTFATHKHYTATASLLAFFVGYLMTRIGMALPQACVACYYVCFAENPSPRLFDSTIPDRLVTIRTGREAMVTTPRFPRRISTA